MTKDVYNLTSPQKNIWLIEKLNPDLNINNVFGLFRINKKLNIEILNKVMNKIIESNDALRIRIAENNKQPYQYITNFEYEDFKTYILNDNDDTELNRIVRRITEQRLPIIDNKLYDIRIIQNNVETCVCVKLHHIISDAWTLGQIAEQIKINYLKISNNETIDIKPSYLEYIEKDKKYRVSNKYLIDKEFWEDYVKELDCENKYEISKDKRSKRIQKKLKLETYEKIHTFCENNKITEYSFFLAIISIYFSKIFNKENIVIGTPFLNRKKADKELDMMGMFIATLPINIKIKGEMNFIETCKNINSINMKCYKHSKYPYYEIQKAYQEFTKENINLYEIAFSYQINKLDIPIEGDIGTTTWISNNTQTNPLLISYLNHFGEHILYYDYMLACLSENEISEIHNRIIVIIEQVTKNGLISINEINILSKKDLQLINKFNDTGNIKKNNETIISRFNKVLFQNKNKVAVSYGNKKVTYNELNSAANSICKIIQSKNIRNKAISIILDKNIDFIISILGVLKSGNYYVPILPEETEDRIEYILKDSKSNMVITSRKNIQKINDNEILKIYIDDLKLQNSEIEEINCLPNDECYLIYTSGTTGKPKGVIMKNENIISLINSMNSDEDLKYLRDDVTISLLKHSFDASAIDIYSSILNGGTLVLVPIESEFNAKEVVKIINKEKVTRVFTVHKWIEQIQNVSIEDNIRLDKLRIIGTGAEVLKPKKFEQLLLKNPNIKIYNTYGPTEATMFMTKHKVTKEDVINNYSTIGKLMPYTRAIILDKNNNILPINVKGELVIYEDDKSSQNIAKGYLNKKSLTDKKFIQIKNPISNKICKCYKTGDIAKINQELELEFFGREDDFVKVAGGYLVSLNEVEQRIRELLGENIEITTLATQIKNTKCIILFIKNNSNVKIDEIKTIIDDNITFYMKPKHIIEIDDIPRNKNGKIDRKKLEKFSKNYLNSKNINIHPRTTLEQMIYDKVKKIVKYDFSITDDFEDDLELDSLNMTRLYVELENPKMTIQDLYNYSSVKDLANMMKSEIIFDNEKEKINIRIKNNSKQFNMKTVLLTGVTGFVGVNLLRELVEDKNINKIYCIVRTKINLSSKERFEKTIKDYFNEDTFNKIIKKTIVLDGDLTKEDLGLSKEIYKLIKNEVTTVINCAANVKHVGKYFNFYRDNVKTVINLINICKENNIGLAHISTLSLHGFKNGNQNEIFNENNLNINQNFDKSPYLISKYEAERKILKEINNSKINAKIFRIGNIMPRKSDGVFQKNFEQNAFMLAIKEFNNIGINTAEIMNSELYLTPVDECTKAINLILNSNYPNTIYHIESDKIVKVSDIVKIIDDKENNINTTNVLDLKEQLYKNYNVGVEHLKAIINNNTNMYSKDITLNILKELNFNWQEIDSKYLKNIVNIASKIGDGNK